MISFRYHIVSITAVFLALGLGVAFGSTVRPTSALTRSRINALTGDLNNARAEIAGLRGQVQASDAIVKNLAARVTRGALAARQVTYADDGAEGAWEGNVRGVMANATAQDAGSLVLTGNWAAGARASSDLSSIAGSAGISTSGSTPAEAVMGAVGDRLGRPDGMQLLASLVKAGYVRTAPKTPEPWPPAGGGLIVFTSGATTSLAAVGLATFAIHAAATMPVLVVGAAPDDAGAVAVLRGIGGLPPHLATFDSGSTDATGVAAVLALSAAIEGRGGNFGTAPGLSYLPRT